MPSLLETSRIERFRVQGWYLCTHRETKFKEKPGCHVWQEDCVDFVNVLRSEGKSCLVLFAIE
jgi:hypothetical protein